MKEIIDFLTLIEKLKVKKRKGWLAHQIKNSESTASHIFRMAILSWLLSKRKGFNVEKVLKMAIIHDLCEVFSEDVTPYGSLLPKEHNSSEERKTTRRILKKWPKFSLEEKIARKKKKFKEECRALLKIISSLPPDLKKELEELWLDFEKGLSKEGRFVKQADKAENFLQGAEYWKKYGRIQMKLWIRWAMEIFDEPIFQDFERAVERKLLARGSAKTKKEKEMDRTLEFLIETGKLKNLAKTGLILIGMINPRTIADHIFRLTMMVWFFGKGKKLNIEKAIKIALFHDICEVYAGDETPYDKILPKDKKKWPELFDKWPRFSHQEKIKMAQERHIKEKQSLIRLLSLLPKRTRDEIFSYWLDYENGTSKEGRFVKQVNRLETLLQALECARENKEPPFKSWVIGTKERVDDPLLIEVIDGLERKFSEVYKYKRRDNLVKTK